MRLPPETEAKQKKGGGQRRHAKGGGQRRHAKDGAQKANSAESAPLRGKKHFGRQKSLTKHAKNGKLYHAGFASGPLARARSRGRPPIRPAAAGTQTNLQRCLSGLRSTTGNRVYLVRVPRVQIPLSAPKEHSFYGCSFILYRLYAEFSIFAFAELCTRVHIDPERDLDVTMPRQTLTDVRIDAAFRAKRRQETQTMPRRRGIFSAT